jgi:uncharacterized protein YbjT (DUF2867 family)/uncharacterized protein YndB with AHSA1/START domain
VLHGVSVAYYLIHSMMGGEDFHERDVRAARNFASAAREASVQRLVYLGGLGDPDAELSEHLRSRQETGEALREPGVPVTEFRAAVIVGSGSLSFEMIRYLTERLPAMVCPKWVYTRTQPISIHNVLDYLLACLRAPESSGKIIEIGGANIVTYQEMMTGYARARGLKRWMIPVPVLTPRLSSYWVHLVTPIPASIAQPLIQGLHNENIVRSDTAQQLFPDIHPIDYQTAVEQALEQLNAGNVETAWTDALVTSQGDVPPVVLATQEGMILERRQLIVPAPPEAVFRAFTGLGGKRGWLYMNWAWNMRGAIDLLVGGVGMRRGRRDPDEVRVGDALDFWRVEAVEPSRLLRLRAEMKVAGRGWLQFQVRPQPDGSSILSQTAFYAPKGLFGLLYWYLLHPLHAIIFSGMIRKIAERAVQLSQSP